MAKHGKGIEHGSHKQGSGQSIGPGADKGQGTQKIGPTNKPGGIESSQNRAGKGK
jgi:hypothetical protein